jgi:L-ectoine synthase
MIVRTLDEIVGTDRDVDAEGWNSRRLLLANDGMGFSMHDTLIKPGHDLHLHYKHHLEAVYCIEGKGSIETVSDGKRWEISAGTIYALNEHDKHVLRAEEQMRMVCVFNPPVTGREVHRADGSYAPADET